MTRIPTLLALALLLAGPAASPQDKKRKGPGWNMDYGPFLASSVSTTDSDKDDVLIANKALSIKVGKNATFCFDTDLVRAGAGWTGGWLDFTKTHHVSGKGILPTRYQGEIRFRTPKGPGWARKGSFQDPRKDGRGPLPRDWAHFKGLYLHENRVVLSYTVGNVPVREMPSYVEASSAAAFLRELNVGPSKSALVLRLAERDPEIPITVTEASSISTVSRGDSGIVVTIPPRDRNHAVTVALWVKGKPEASAVPRPRNLAEFCAGGPRRWDQDVTTRGSLGRLPDAYVVDTAEPPFKNPWNSWLRITAGDFFSNGDAAICTWSGDVWTVTGLDKTFEKLTWRRFAAGLYEPLGLKVVDDTVYVLARDQITRLRDLNGDGEADLYENFNNDCITMANYHAFAFDLQTDSKGNFYYSRCGHRVAGDVPYHGCIIRVPKDGGPHEIVAKGFRAPNGLSVGPNDEITAGDNQGNWMPASKVNWVRQGGFYGYMTHPWRDREKPKDFEPPICWLPHKLDNSSGGQIWVTSDKWGPFKGHLLHTSYGKGTLFHIPFQRLGDVVQGAAIQFPLTFASGIMRGRFNPVDGQLYVFGIGGGWQSAMPRHACLQRVRYTGLPVNSILDYAVTKKSVRLTFTDPLRRETAENLEYYAASWWNYRWSEKYGSDDYLVSDPGKRGREEVKLKSARLSEDGKTVELEIPGIRPVMQLLIRMRLRAADGSRISADLYATINHVP